MDAKKRTDEMEDNQTSDITSDVSESVCNQSTSNTSEQHSQPSMDLLLEKLRGEMVSKLYDYSL